MAMQRAEADDAEGLGGGQQWNEDRNAAEEASERIQSQYCPSCPKVEDLESWWACDPSPGHVKESSRGARGSIDTRVVSKIGNT